MSLLSNWTNAPRRKNTQWSWNIAWWKGKSIEYAEWEMLCSNIWAWILDSQESFNCNQSGPCVVFKYLCKAISLPDLAQLLSKNLLSMVQCLASRVQQRVFKMTLVQISTLPCQSDSPVSTSFSHISWDGNISLQATHFWQWNLKANLEIQNCGFLFVQVMTILMRLVRCARFKIFFMGNQWLHQLTPMDVLHSCFWDETAHLV